MLGQIKSQRCQRDFSDNLTEAKPIRTGCNLEESRLNFAAPHERFQRRNDAKNEPPTG